MRNYLFAVPLALLLIGSACSKGTNVNTTNAPSNTNAIPAVVSNPANALTVLQANDRTNKQAKLETSKGTIIFELFGDEAPIAVSNFITLANKGFFNGLTFHRYVEGFVIQGGDPTGSGSGGPGYSFINEQVTREYTAGTVAMANAGADTNGSQFFIMLADASTLPKDFPIFGKVTSGMENVLNLRQGDKMTKVTIKPLETT